MGHIIVPNKKKSFKNPKQTAQIFSNIVQKNYVRFTKMPKKIGSCQHKFKTKSHCLLKHFLITVRKYIKEF